MLNHHIDLVPGQSFHVGNLRVTLVCVNGDEVAIRVDPNDDGSGDAICELIDGSHARSESELILA